MRPSRKQRSRAEREHKKGNHGKARFHDSLEKGHSDIVAETAADVKKRGKKKMFGKRKRFQEPRKPRLIKFVVQMNGLYWRQNGFGGRWSNKVQDAEVFDDLNSALHVAREAHGWVFSINSLTGRIRPIMA